MSLTIKEIKGRSCPVVTCEECSSVVTKAELGMVAWDCDGSLSFLHKEPCSHSFERARVGSHRSWEHFPWQELHVFLANLRWNSGERSPELREKAEELAGMGLSL